MAGTIGQLAQQRIAEKLGEKASGEQSATGFRALMEQFEQDREERNTRQASLTTQGQPGGEGRQVTFNNALFPSDGSESVNAPLFSPVPSARPNAHRDATPFFGLGMPPENASGQLAPSSAPQPVPAGSGDVPRPAPGPLRRPPPSTGNIPDSQGNFAPGERQPSAENAFGDFQIAQDSGTMNDASSSRSQFANRLIQNGLPAHVAAGFAGNVEQESRFRTDAKGDKDKHGNPRSFGALQLQGPRKVAFDKFVDENGLDPASLNTAADFVVFELNTTEGRSLRSLESSSSVEEATQIISDQYFRPSNPIMANRVRNARGAANELGLPVGQETTPVPPFRPDKIDAIPGGRMSADQRDAFTRATQEDSARTALTARERKAAFERQELADRNQQLIDIANRTAAPPPEVQQAPEQAPIAPPARRPPSPAPERAPAPQARDRAAAKVISDQQVIVEGLKKTNPALAKLSGTDFATLIRQLKGTA